MFWVIQNNLYGEINHATLMQSLECLQILHIKVKIIPFCDKLIPSNFDSFDHYNSIDEIAEVEIDNNQQIMVCGAISLARIAKNRNWQPGSFLNENFHYSKWVEAYGNNILNYNSVVDTFENINPQWEEFFIRPCEDTKDFNGSVFSKEEFKRLKVIKYNKIL